ncbi:MULTISPECIES: AraC family transcriptional regulator [Microbacterium]|uniref:helix-turn-helix transcriptional regulator n=1 Tax=Microbacterium TaxID=33882 RepID=UPI0012AC6B51|nr:MULTISPECIES: AraC family transcriptional regulator [Microbacterium]MCD2169477.1 AraC family transcriptional regulator [Microbacterium sp. JC 701]
MVDRVRAWHPEVPLLRESYHAELDHAYPVHTHDDWAVMLVDRGVVSYALDGGAYYAAPSAVTVLPPGIPHDGRSARAGEGYRKRVLYLGGEWLLSETAARIARRPTLADPQAMTAARRVHAALRHPGDELAAEHWLLAVREAVLAHAGSGIAAAADAPLARRLRALLDDRTSESFTLADAARELNAHPSHLVRVFSQTYGIAPHRYLVTRRVDTARRLLVDGVRPAEAAVRAGFHDQSHLTRHFRRVLGVTPAAFATSGGRMP